MRHGYMPIGLQAPLTVYGGWVFLTLPPRTATENLQSCCAGCVRGQRSHDVASRSSFSSEDCGHFCTLCSGTNPDADGRGESSLCPRTDLTNP